MENEGSKRVTPDFSHLFQSEPYHFFFKREKVCEWGRMGFGGGLGGKG